METVAMISAVLSLVAGVGVFIIACTMLSSNIESVGSRPLKNMFSRASENKLLGVGIGAGATAAVQSSAATIVLVIGFVNAGIMSLGLAATIIYGANIGTTITAWIASMSTVNSGNSLSLMIIFSTLVGIGAFVNMFAKKDSTKSLGGILMGFGLIFVGLHMMSTSMSEFAGSEEIKSLLSGINNIFLLILIGFLITALTQSSSVTTAIIITMLPVGAATGLLTLEQAIYITLGANIGSCIIVLLSGHMGTVNAKRAAYIHLFFNVFGVLLFVIAGFIMGAFGTTYSDMFSQIFPGFPAWQLATFHTAFKVITTIIMLPLTSIVLSFIVRLFPDTEVPDRPHLFYLDINMLRNPPVAVQQLKLEVLNMSSIAMTNFRLSLDMITKLEFDSLEVFNKNEEELDYLNKEIAAYLIKLSNQNLSTKDRLYVSSVYHAITDIERMGDHAQNIVEYAQKMKDTGGSFSDIAKGEIYELDGLVNQLYDKIMDAYTTIDLQKVEEAFDIEDRIDNLTKDMSEKHIKRLNDGICALEVGAEYLSLASDAERVADHLINLGKSVRQFA